ncbi:patatin-like phospholipase family protein [Angustibacter peucedani]
MTRRGLVLGGGGVLGAAWMVGALVALEEHLGVDLRESEALVGTSAGSVVAALLAAGVSVDELRLHQSGLPLPSGLLSEFRWDYETATGSGRPPRPRPGLGSAGLIARNVSHLRRLPPTAVLSALLPEGRGSLESVGAMVKHVVPHGWVDREGLQVVTMDYETGRRVPFGRPGAPVADLAEAVMASCAIPGWYQPVRIGTDRYVDGGACSSTSVDLLAGQGLDEVWVVAPSVSFAMDAPDQLVTRLERQWRVRVTRRCLREVAKVHAGGTEVTVIGPGPEDLAEIGGNLMDVARRRTVLETSLRTSADSLRDPEPLDALPARVDDAEAAVGAGEPDLDGEVTSDQAPRDVVRREVGS